MAAGKETTFPAALAEARKSETVPEAIVSSAADWVAVQTAASAAALAEARKGEAGPEAIVSSAADWVAVQAAASAAELAEARKGEAGSEAIVSSDASSDAAEQAATTGAASLPVASAGAGMSAVAAPPASLPMASAGVKMSAVAAPPVVVAPSAGTQPNHFRGGPEELPKKNPDVEPLIRRAAAYRVKFRRDGGLVCLPFCSRWGSIPRTATVSRQTETGVHRFA